MTGPLQRALGADWHRLPPALQAHYREGATVEHGHLDIEFPPAMQPLLRLLAWLGALVHRRGRAVDTCVEKQVLDGCVRWHRLLRYPDGQVLRFDSVWMPAEGARLVEFVNPLLGLEMAPSVVGHQLHYRGVRFILRLGSVQLPIAQWLGPGETRIVEQAVDERRFAMDFRMTHPWFGELFRYSGVFEVDAAGSGGRATPGAGAQGAAPVSS